ncbi:alanine--glyoxylate aminotransferase 2, mitochondrial isoform X1 [Polypterus senegalus]|uniref:alanine--glyoxylate aminotransferase 2, mitochondrial isoform X1 n=1 Tax=Polypterus senegalus TaxID=55291 RepID=UPI001966884E|nr:alanine--glyoxylate aminotransferase 2, mitochondrial isoform X1 [Polypterus senegalus]
MFRNLVTSSLFKHPCKSTGALATFHRLSGALKQQLAINDLPADCPQLPPCEFTPEEYKFLSEQQMMEIRKRYCGPTTMVNTYYKKPVAIRQGFMQWLWDLNGKRYLDFFSGVATVSVGHCHPRVNAAAKKQMERLWHTTNIYLHNPLHEYCEKLAALFPEPLKSVYLTNSGSEANDLAMLLARLYTGNFDIITFRGAYHGGSPHSVGLTRVGSYRFPVATGLGCHQTMCPDVYSGIWGGSHCRDCLIQADRKCSCTSGSCHAKDMYLEQLKDTLDTSMSKSVAGFFAEPIQGVGGVVQYPKGYLKEAFKMIRERGGVCIADEVQTGFGRTGKDIWAFKAHDVVPDIVTMAKGIANGFPMGAVITSRDIADTLTRALHFNTFGGNPIGCAAGSAVIDALLEDKLAQNSTEVGAYLLTGLAKLQSKFEIIGDVRGKGLLIGVEMVKDKVTRKPLPDVEMNQIFEDCKDMGLLLGKGGVHGQTFRMKPPLCVTKADADFALAVFELALKSHEKRQ